MQVVVDVTGKAVDDKLTNGDLRQLQQVATENPRPDHQRLMRAILRAVTDGPEGIAAARHTAAHLVEMYFVFSCERYLGLKMYEIRLRRSRQADDHRE